MPIATYEAQTETVPLPPKKVDGKPVEQSFEVRGLSLGDITYLVENHLADLIKAVDLYSKNKGGPMSQSVLTEFALLLAKDMPRFAAELIALAADEPGEIERVVKMPVMVQMTAFMAVIRLTIEDAGGLKNLLAFVAPVIRDVVNSAGLEPGTLKHKLVASIMASAKMSASSLEPDTETLEAGT